MSSINVEQTTFSASMNLTVILRLYPAYSGYGHANLQVASYVSIRKAFVTKLLEDSGNELNIMRADDSEESGFFLRFDFRGFEVKTVKLELAIEGVVHLNLRSKSPHLYLLILLPMTFCRNGHSWVAIDKLHLA